MKILKTNFLVIAILLMLGAPAFAFTAGELTSYQNAQNLSTSGAYAVSGNIGINTTAPRGTLEVDGTTYLMSGNVGVGTTGPRAQLEVGNAASVTAGANAAAIIKNDLVVDGKIYGDGSGLTGLASGLSGLTGATTYGMVPRASSATSLVDSSIYQDVNGNIGIGTTRPGSFLTVDSGAGTSDTLDLINNGVTNAPILNVTFTNAAGAPPSSNALVQIASTGGSTRPLLTAGGNLILNSTGHLIDQTMLGDTAFSMDDPSIPLYTLTVHPFVIGAAKVGYQFNTISVVGGSQNPMTFDNAGNVGIGTTAPQQKLDVEANVYFGSGNVGINTTGTRALLEVGTAASVTSGANAAAIIKNDLVVDGKIYGDGSGLTSVAGALSGLTATRVPVASGSSTLVDSVIYNIGNNVGIGTTAPGAPLQVSSVFTYGLASKDLILIEPMFSGATMGVPSTHGGIAWGAPGAPLGRIQLVQDDPSNYFTSHLEFWTHDGATISEKMRLAGNGNVGIGTTGPIGSLEVDGNVYVKNANIGISTSAPRAKLEIGNAASVTAGSNAAAIIKNDLVVDGKIYGDGSGLTGLASGLSGLNATRVPVASGSSSIVDSVIYNVGNYVGIGTSAPAASLEVDSSGTTSATSAFILNNAARTNLITVLDNGNVGIGTTAPTQLFQVGGNLAVGGVGDTYVGGNLGVGVDPPTVALDVNGTVHATAFVGDGSGLTNVAGVISGIDPGYLPRARTSSTVVDSGVYQDVNGNVGIGTSVPAAKFEVDGIIYGTNIGINTTGPRALLEVGTAASVTAGANAAAIIKNDLVVDGNIYAASGSKFIGDGSGLTGVTGGSGGMAWNEVTGTSATMAVNSGYIANNAGLVTLTLPATAPVGTVVAVTGHGAGGWKIAQNASGVIHFASQNTTSGTGGYLASTATYDSAELVCIVANNEWVVRSSVGNITVN